MVYLRVLPRDLFNEADLLKCYGRLWIVLDETRSRTKFETEYTEGPFNVEQDPSSGSIYVANVSFTIRGQPWRLMRPLNSRSPWPLYAETENDSVPVFDDVGNLSTEMLELITVEG